MSRWSPFGQTISGRGSTTPTDRCKSLQTQGRAGLDGQRLVFPLKSKWTDHPGLTSRGGGVRCR